MSKHKEFSREVTGTYKGIELEYVEHYIKSYPIDENGVQKDHKEVMYTDVQVSRNRHALHKAYAEYLHGIDKLSNDSE